MAKEKDSPGDSHGEAERLRVEDLRRRFARFVVELHTHGVIDAAVVEDGGLGIFTVTFPVLREVVEEDPHWRGLIEALPRTVARSQFGGNPEIAKKAMEQLRAGIRRRTARSKR